MASPYLILWARGEPTTYTVEFDVNESGHYPMAVNHRSAFYVGDGLKLRVGRGWVSKQNGGAVTFNTEVQEGAGET